MNFNSRKDFVFITLAGFFITNAIVAELVSGKLIQFFNGTFTQALGVILWPFVFLLTDLINEHYGKEGVKKLTYITVGLIAYAFILVTIGIQIPGASFSPVSDEVFKIAFGPSQWIMIGSITAFFTSQLVDVYIFWMLRNWTGSKMIWLRATGSTLISQLIDTFVVQYIGFVLPQVWSVSEWLKNASYGYFFKLIVAICLIPFIYLGHYFLNKYLDQEKGDL